MSDPVHVAAALDCAGWHPAAWRESAASTTALTTLKYWQGLIREADSGGVDFVTIEDAFGLPDGTPVPGRAVGRLDALLIASAVAPTTKRVGLIPTVTTTHTEPFHVATALQTLDHVSRGRGGWRVQASPRRSEAELFGRREVPDLTLDDLRAGRGSEFVRDLFDEAADVIEVVRRLWDSWEDDAVVRDTATGRFLDRDRIHGADFEGRWFGVTGASIVPRSPQGQLPVTVLAHRDEPYELAARQADLVYVTPQGESSAAGILRSVRDAERRVDRLGEPLRVYADLLVLLDDTAPGARDRLARLDDLGGSPVESDALVVATTADDLVARIEAWRDLGYDGFRLRPARLPDDLTRITRDLLPALARAGLRRPADDAGDLRSRLGLGHAVNRYSAASAAVKEEVSA